MDQQADDNNMAVAQALVAIQAQLQNLGDRMTQLEQLQPPSPRRVTMRDVPPPQDNFGVARYSQEVDPEPPDILKRTPRRLDPSLQQQQEHPCHVSPRTFIFTGSSNPESYIAWEFHMEELFDCYNYTDSRKIATAAAQLTGNALSWWTREASERRRHHYTQISSWKDMKQHLRKRYVPCSFQKNFPNCFDRLIPSHKVIKERGLEPQDKWISVRAKPEQAHASVKVNIQKSREDKIILNRDTLHKSQAKLYQEVIQASAEIKASSDITQNSLIYPMTSIMHLSMSKDVKGYSGTKEKPMDALNVRVKEPSNNTSMFGHKKSHEVLSPLLAKKLDAMAYDHIHPSQTQSQDESNLRPHPLDNGENKVNINLEDKLTRDANLIGVTKDESSKQTKTQSHYKFKPNQNHGVLYGLLIKESESGSTIKEKPTTTTKENYVLDQRLKQEDHNTFLPTQTRKHGPKAKQGVIYSLLIKEQPHAHTKIKPSIQHPQGKHLDSFLYSGTNLLSLHVGKTVLRTKHCQEGGNDEDLKSNPKQSHPIEPNPEIDNYKVGIQGYQAWDPGEQMWSDLRRYQTWDPGGQMWSDLRSFFTSFNNHKPLEARESLREDRYLLLFKEFQPRRRSTTKEEVSLNILLTYKDEDSRFEEMKTLNGIEDLNTMKNYLSTLILESLREEKLQTAIHLESLGEEAGSNKYCTLFSLTMVLSQWVFLVRFLMRQLFSDEDIAASKDIQAPSIPNHPMTRSRAKKLQEAFNLYTEEITTQNHLKTSTHSPTDPKESYYTSCTSQDSSWTSQDKHRKEEIEKTLQLLHFGENREFNIFEALTDHEASKKTL